MLAPCLSLSEEGCATRPPPHAGSGKAGRGVSLPFIPASREVTRSRGQARRGHGKEVGGWCHIVYYSVSYCWACGCPPPLLLNTSRNHGWEGKGQVLPPLAWEHPNCLGSNSLSY